MKNKILPHYLIKNVFFAILLCLMIALMFGCSTQSSTSAHDFYQIKVYHLTSQVQMERIDQFMKNAYIPAMHRAGIAKVGVFKPKEQESDENLQVWVWVPFKSLKQFGELEDVLLNDTQFQNAGDDYINATHDNPPYERIESMLLKAFDDMPQFGSFTYDNPVKDRIYELRSYESATEKKHLTKVDMFNSGEVEIFKEIGANPLFFGKVISGPSMPNLVYMTTYADSVSHPIIWDKFRTHPDWLSLKVIEKYKNTVSKNTKYFLYPAEYSDI
jgi:hypothetical protein